MRQRDRFLTMAHRLRPGKSSNDHLSTAVSDTELSDNEQKEQDRRRSLDQDDRPGEGSTSRRNSAAKSFGLKTGFSFRRKGSKPSQPKLEVEKMIPIPTVPNPPSIRSPLAVGGPTNAQAAYIQRILADPSGEKINDPLGRIRRASSGDGEHVSISTDSGLIESLKAFTSVEVLEGENAFACKRCWKVKRGKSKGTQSTVQEEDEPADASKTFPSSTIQSQIPPPSLAVVNSGPAGTGPACNVQSSLGSSGLSAPISGSSALNRAPSPLRHRTDDASSVVTTTESTSLHSTETDSMGDPDNDGLSDTDTSDEEQPEPLATLVGRPKMPPRKKSSHFVMRRAF